MIFFDYFFKKSEWTLLLSSMKYSITFHSFHLVHFVTCTQFFYSFIIFAIFSNLTFGRFPIFVQHTGKANSSCKICLNTVFACPCTKQIRVYLSKFDHLSFAFVARNIPDISLFFSNNKKIHFIRFQLYLCRSRSFFYESKTFLWIIYYRSMVKRRTNFRESKK